MNNLSTFLFFKLLALAVSIILYIVALALAPLAVLANSQFFRPITNGFIARSAALLSISKEPSSKNILHCRNCFLSIF